ncbi:MAG: GlsB/YeaQ/YmgE family stress response membrane protein [Sinimarinibacterium flocculans]|mgnify:CR=1 FL=1|uniref:Putative membrane protein YeaQ/YmgE (Transglycosylase-associated protein family) n=1 Tax=Sinimarinibacterium flocculans TaxID=985250 RepID=A0A318EE70_9GAMM|nr:GlsB/YeaQ/YmgE family stress response membrane protein [Sinimarinibacterium flocculans]MEC9364519.1 GlsB/YeaQ/YmgE family stress response membrane protein [Pseudomonadota bacterium]PXV68513.1 putative membrane protein YeaQ/YmgE (transglycosylase-associated protein family) [Sinimarinibacterium flocculans]
MGILSWIVLGLVAGLLAKALMPGKDPGGLIITILLGIAGAFVGGWLGTELGIASFNGFTLQGIGVATAGAVVLLVLYRLIKKKT